MSREPEAGPLPTVRLLIRVQGADRFLHDGLSYRIGRDPQADIVVTDPRVSWQHATVGVQDGSWLLQDTGSTNGTFVNGERVRQFAITGDCAVRLAHPDDGPVLNCSPSEAVLSGEAVPGAVPAGSAPAPRLLQTSRDRPPSMVTPLRAMPLRIGRAEGNDVVVPELGVSRFHAELRPAKRGGFEIVDLDSYNGTFLNGQRITVAPVTEDDLVGIGPATFRLVGDELQEFIDTGDISLAAFDLTARLASGKVLLDHVSFPLGGRCLLGVIGPSGAGKSTLLGALTGIRPATEGTVTYDGRDLYRHYAELQHRIGLVPQDNILHTQLSPRTALGYAAKLRFPRDTSKAERDHRIDEVLAELGLTEHADTRISALSGGQRKRVNVALELLTRPSLLFLDEPTSGLDAGLDKSVMQMMADLAHDGRTVIVVTHSVANLDLCDRLLVLVPGGKVAYFGPPEEGLRHFAKPGWAEVFQAFDAQPGRDWASEYRSSTYYRRYLAAEMSDAASVPRPAAQPRPPAASRNGLAQIGTLCRRYLAVIAADRSYLAALAFLPLLMGLLIRAIPAPQGLAGPDNVKAQSLLLVLAVGGALTGAANAVRELVKERTVYERERAAGLSAGAYLTSKLLVLGVISCVQALVMLAVGLTGRRLPPAGAALTHLPLLELLLAIGALSVTSMALGLLISALVNSSDKTMPLLVVSVMFQLILCGGIFPLNGKPGLDQLSWLSPSRWSYAATAATSNLNKIMGPTGMFGAMSPDPLWDHNLHTWLLDMLILLVLGLAFALFTWRRLVRMGPARRR